MSNKRGKIPREQMKRLVPNLGACYASDRVMVDGLPVGYMYRQEREHDDGHSGWAFFAGTEDQAYTDDPSNFHIYEVNTIANYDPDIIPCLDAEFGAAFERIPSTSKFREMPFPTLDD